MQWFTYLEISFGNGMCMVFNWSATRYILFIGNELNNQKNGDVLNQLFALTLDKMTSWLLFWNTGRLVKINSHAIPTINIYQNKTKSLQEEEWNFVNTKQLNNKNGWILYIINTMWSEYSEKLTLRSPKDRVQPLWTRRELVSGCLEGSCSVVTFRLPFLGSVPVDTRGDRCRSRQADDLPVAKEKNFFLCQVK